MNNIISILCTAEVGNSAVEQARENDIEVDIAPFIDVSYVENELLSVAVKELAKEQVTVVFTSKHAVQWVGEKVKGEEVDWLIYCLSNKTKSIVNQYFSKNKIISIDGDAGELADKLIGDGVNDIVFFCGDRRMDTLPDMMKNEGVNVREYVVYSTIDTPHVIEKKYDGILFFSPSGVDSFFRVNEAKEGMAFFSIGDTTAEAIRKYTNNKIVISKVSTKEQVLLDAVKYFKTI